MRRTKPLLERFMAKVSPEPNTGCWLWTGSITAATGYGKIYSGHNTPAGHGLPASAHRVSYELHRGSIPEGMEVCHKCDVRSCVNPEHLFIGTRSDNMRDMVNKGRHVSQVHPGCWGRGETHPLWKGGPNCPSRRRQRAAA